jgi:hypothetical protein
MSENPRKNESEQPWPLCAEAQADGVPCTALGRECDVCERAYPLLRDREPKKVDDEGPLPVSGA